MMAQISIKRFPHLVRLVKGASFASIKQEIHLSAQEAATALRPFYFAVHPDLFWQHPKEKDINETSLKQLNAHLEMLTENRSAHPVSVTFFLRGTQQNGNHSRIEKGPFKQVEIRLLNKSLYNAVHNILSSCQLSTAHLDQIATDRRGTSRAPVDRVHGSKQTAQGDIFDQSVRAWERMRATAEAERQIRNKPEVNLRTWLVTNIAEAQRRLEACQPIREEVVRLAAEVKDSLGLQDIVWDCDWGMTHFRGCLQSFKGLVLQHTADIGSSLRGRTLVFGRQTGVSLDGHIILSTEDVRHNWLDLIRSFKKYDPLLQQVPAAECTFSEVLLGIRINHRKFQPTRMVQNYIQQLEKLTAAFYKYRWQHGFPTHWPRRLDNFQLVVECEAGPLMLSPTGQFIAPASCPAFLLVDFISKNMDEANRRIQEYQRAKEEEQQLYNRCLTELGLLSLQKADNVTPNLMVQCCERLLQSSHHWTSFLRGCHVQVANYYSVLQDGEICIPWDWKEV